MINVKINGVLYKCVSSITPVLETENKYDVITLDGNRHRKFKGIKTSYNIVFYNDLSGDFETLMETLVGSAVVELSIPIGQEYFTADYFPQITSYKAKGFLNNGTFYNNGLAVSFDKVKYNE